MVLRVGSTRSRTQALLMFSVAAVLLFVDVVFVTNDRSVI